MEYRRIWGDIEYFLDRLTSITLDEPEPDRPSLTDWYEQLQKRRLEVHLADISD